MINLIILWNIVVFLIYGTDKLFAKINCRRIPEKVMIICSMTGGGIGAILGMQIFRHKIRKNKFKILVPVALVITGIVIYLIMKNR